MDDGDAGICRGRNSAAACNETHSAPPRSATPRHARPRDPPHRDPAWSSNAPLEAHQHVLLPRGAVGGGGGGTAAMCPLSVL